MSRIAPKKRRVCGNLLLTVTKIIPRGPFEWEFCDIASHASFTLAFRHFSVKLLKIWNDCQWNAWQSHKTNFWKVLGFCIRNWGKEIPVNRYFLSQKVLALNMISILLASCQTLTRPPLLRAIPFCIYRFSFLQLGPSLPFSGAKAWPKKCLQKASMSMMKSSDWAAKFE